MVSIVFRLAFLQICFLISTGSFHQVDGFEKVIPQKDVTDVHLIFMNHLDVGYSDFSKKGLVGNVLNSYFTVYFPEAIKRSKELTDGGYIETFKYTTHPFLLDLYLNCPENLELSGIHIQCPNESQVMSMHNAINENIIQWHAGAMNIQYELLTPLGINMSLDMSSRLDKMFAINKSLRVLSQRDVPGISRGIIPHLVANNVLGISHGVNSGSATSAVPSMFRWRQAPPYSSSGALEVLYIQNKAGYPNPPGKDPNHPWGLSTDQCFRAPTTGHVLCFSFRNDNTGPPESITEVLHAYEILRARYPHAHIFASSFEKFFTILDTVREHLPVVDQEIGDTWIQGTISDPRKMSDYKSISNAFEECFQYSQCDLKDRRIVNASRFFVKLSEHTWGLNTENDTVHWTNKEFEKMRNYTDFQLVEHSWNEQRHFINLTIEALENHPVLNTINKYMTNARLPPGSSEPPDLSMYTLINHYNFSCRSQKFQITKDGIIQVTGIGNFQIRYRTYNESDTTFFLHYYSMGWNTGFGKPNSTINAAPHSKFWQLNTKSIYVRDISNGNSCQFYVFIQPVDSTASSYYGSPTGFWLHYQSGITTVSDSVTVEWFDKNATRLMEAIYLQFLPDPSLLSTREFFFSKIDSLISPYNVVQNGSQWQHGIDSKGVVLKCKRASSVCRDLSIQSLHTYLVSPITKSYGPTVWPAPLKPIGEQVIGVAFPLYTNVWMTNFIFWYPYFGPNNVNDKSYKAQFNLKTHGISSNNLVYRRRYN